MAFDLDNEELKATRKLHNQDDGLYEETSDKNVANDIKILKKFCEYEEAVVLTDNALEEVQDAINNILAEREQDKKKIQELEAENRENKKKYLALLIGQFPDTTETYKKYKKELEELLEGEK